MFTFVESQKADMVLWGWEVITGHSHLGYLGYLESDVATVAAAAAAPQRLTRTRVPRPQRQSIPLEDLSRNRKYVLLQHFPRGHTPATYATMMGFSPKIRTRDW